MIFEVRLIGQVKIQVPTLQFAKNFGIAHIGAGRDVAVGDTKGQPPRVQHVSGGNVAERKAVTFENRMAGEKRLIAMLNPSTSGQASAGNGDVITGRGQASNVMKGIGLGHGETPRRGELLRMVSVVFSGVRSLSY